MSLGELPAPKPPPIDSPRRRGLDHRTTPQPLGRSLRTGGSPPGIRGRPPEFHRLSLEQHGASHRRVLGHLNWPLHRPLTPPYHRFSYGCPFNPCVSGTSKGFAEPAKGRASATSVCSNLSPTFQVRDPAPTQTLPYLITFPQPHVPGGGGSAAAQVFKFEENGYGTQSAYQG